MKKIIVSIMMAGMTFTFLPVNTMAATKTTAAVSSNDATMANALLLRLSAIKNMDVDAMSATEKKGLRKEVRSIKQQLSALGGGVYISAGALIVILILLIILL